jgi:long-chain acyl-CoA synthetase
LTAIALLTLGAVVVPIDPQWPAEEVSQALRFVGARAICASPRFHAELQGANASIALDSLLVTEPGAPPGELSFERARPSSTRLAAIFFTSGTTVEPKAVPLTHANFMANAQAVVGVLDVACPRVLAVLPAFHVVEFLGSLVVPLAIGGSVTFVERIDGEEILRALRASGSTTMTVVPRILELFLLGIEKAVASRGALGSLLFRAMLRVSGATRGVLGRLLFRSVHARFGGHLRLIISVAAALPKSTQIKLRNLGFNVIQAYGITETSPVIAMDLPVSCRPGSVGKPLPGVEVRIDHSDLQQGASSPEGEILVRGPNVMSG